MTRGEFTTRVRQDLMDEIRTIATTQGREVETVGEEALRACVEARRQTKPSAHVMARFHESRERYALLYGQLAEYGRRK